MWNLKTFLQPRWRRKGGGKIYNLEQSEERVVRSWSMFKAQGGVMFASKARNATKGKVGCVITAIPSQNFGEERKSDLSFPP